MLSTPAPTNSYLSNLSGCHINDSEQRLSFVLAVERFVLIKDEQWTD